ncbi:diguanylate cyclase [Sneathiella sp. P13V-1]|uniref:sensor domain-containing diguanylate cyclase n=1 Tax=Sneathiella sp. P13V-1 TaxID=2697366 RepID=UPI00187B6D31|nr:diguanylate cyclase [Sneathiella sp. P13V-1]MBE7635420.1 diguanylate cyclase [Sneathiella sp. P13V-1]
MGKLRNQIAGLGLLGKSGQKGDDLLLNPGLVIDQYPGPAFLVAEDGRLLHANEKSDLILRELTSAKTNGVENLKEAISDGISKQLNLKLENALGEKSAYDIAVVPIENEDESLCLVCALDGSMQYNLIDALVASRQLFKDLITCTAEFVWETDEEGHFQYVSPRGAFGFSAAELDGMNVADLLMGQANQEAGNINPFSVKEPVHAKQIWLRAKDKSPVCMVINSIPVFDTLGNYVGSRGAGHDLTAEIEQKQYLEFLKAQEETVSKIVDAIRREVEADSLFDIAGQGACDALHSTQIVIGRLNLASHLEVAYSKGVSAEIENMLDEWFWKAREAELTSSEVITLQQEDQLVHVAPIQLKDNLHGYIAMVRDRTALAITNDEEALLGVIAGHLGVALIQLTAREMLVELSRTDELSGLLNRRAFNEDVLKRIAHGKRTKRTNTLFYIDLDNFKPVNDRFGHEKGDEVLIAISNLLKESSRVGDLVSRLGGDEFSMWLEDLSEEDAVLKAEKLQKDCLEVSNQLDVHDPSLSFSIGIVMSHGNTEDTLESLLSRADAAMYEVKKMGKGAFALAKDT